MRAETLIELLMRAFDEQMIVQRAERRRERVRIDELPASRAIFGAQSIGETRRRARREALEEAVGMNALETGDLPPLGRDRAHDRCAGDERADRETVSRLVQAQNREGIAMAGADNRGDVLVSRAPNGLGHNLSRHAVSVPFTQ